MKHDISTRTSHSFTLIMAAALAFSCAGSAFAQVPLTAKSLEGVWKVTKIVRAGVADTNPQPVLLIISRGYFSVLRVRAPRKQAPEPKDPKHLTDAEKIALYEEWAPYGASGGTYEVKGNTWINQNVVAKNVKGMSLREEAIITKFDGNSITVSGEPGKPSDTEITYTRLR